MSNQVHITSPSAGHSQYVDKFKDKFEAATTPELKRRVTNEALVALTKLQSSINEAKIKGEYLRNKGENNEKAQKALTNPDIIKQLKQELGQLFGKYKINERDLNNFKRDFDDVAKLILDNNKKPEVVRKVEIIRSNQLIRAEDKNNKVPASTNYLGIATMVFSAAAAVFTGILAYNSF